MATPRLSPECADCGRPRAGKSRRCDDCRARHRRERQTSTQRNRRHSRATTQAAAPGQHGAEPALPATLAARIAAVDTALRHSRPLVKRINQIVGATPVLDDLLHATALLLGELHHSPAPPTRWSAPTTR